VPTQILRASKKRNGGTVDELYDRRAASSVQSYTGNGKAKGDRREESRRGSRAIEQTKFRVALYSEMRRAGPGIEMVRAATKIAPNTFSLPDDLLGDQYAFNRSSEEAYPTVPG
jgi:hypothetical protein